MHLNKSFGEELLFHDQEDWQQRLNQCQYGKNLVAPLTWDQDSLRNCLWKHTAGGKGVIQTLVFMLYKHDDIAVQQLMLGLQLLGQCCAKLLWPWARTTVLNGTSGRHEEGPYLLSSCWHGRSECPSSCSPSPPFTSCQPPEPLWNTGCWGCGRAPGRLPQYASSSVTAAVGFPCWGLLKWTRSCWG